MKKWAVLGGLGLGAGLMYILDPGSGRRRGRPSGGGLRGVLAEATGAFEGPVDDDVLAERVRSRLRRSVSRSDAVGVAVERGVVTLSGTIEAAEFDRLVSAVLKVRGVKDVDDQLAVRATED